MNHGKEYSRIENKKSLPHKRIASECTDLMFIEVKNQWRLLESSVEISLLKSNLRKRNIYQGTPFATISPLCQQPDSYGRDCNLERYGRYICSIGYNARSYLTNLEETKFQGWFSDAESVKALYNAH